MNYKVPQVHVHHGVLQYPSINLDSCLLKNLAQQFSSLTLTSQVSEDLIDHVLTGCFVATEANDFVKADAGLSFTNHAERSHIVRFPE